MKNRINRILCPTDFTTASNNAVEYSAQLAKDLNASLTLWSIYEIPLFDHKSDHRHTALKEIHAMDITSALEEWCQVIKREFGVPCGYTIQKLSSDLQNTITHYTSGKNYDLIILGSNGSDSLSRYFFAKTSYNILEQISYPILLLNEASSYNGIRTIDMKNIKTAFADCEQLREQIETVDFECSENRIMMSGEAMDLFNHLSSVLNALINQEEDSSRMPVSFLNEDQSEDLISDLTLMHGRYIDQVTEDLCKNSHHQSRKRSANGVVFMHGNY